MTAKLKIDGPSFNRGVREVVTLKPLVRAAGEIVKSMSGKPSSGQRSTSKVMAGSSLVQRPKSTSK